MTSNDNPVVFASGYTGKADFYYDGTIAGSYSSNVITNKNKEQKNEYIL